MYTRLGSLPTMSPPIERRAHYRVLSISPTRRWAEKIIIGQIDKNFWKIYDPLKAQKVWQTLDGEFSFASLLIESQLEWLIQEISMTPLSVVMLWCFNCFGKHKQKRRKVKNNFLIAKSTAPTRPVEWATGKRKLLWLKLLPTKFAESRSRHSLGLRGQPRLQLILIFSVMNFDSFLRAAAIAVSEETE